MRTISIIGLTIILIFFLSSCVAGPNQLEKKPDQEGKIAGFWKGLWHGLISPFTFIISIFTRNVRIYEVHNSGFWYNFGFVIGAGILFHGGFFGARFGKKKKK